MKRVEVKVNTANVLRYLGSLYRNPADAIKEYISNALDSFLANPGAVNHCHVVYQLTPGSVIISYNTPGMNKKEFETALQNVADSVKLGMAVHQIGRLGIGIWAFHQIGRRAEFLSKKSSESETVKVVLREGNDQAEFSSALKREELKKPGMTIRITGLKTNPTLAKSPLSAKKLCSFFAEKFDSYLRKGSLEVDIFCKNQLYKVEPMEITLPVIAKDYSVHYVNGDQNKKIELSLWFEPAGKGKVTIRHMGIPIVEDISTISAYGLEESVFARGSIMGYIDADFLIPLPARTAFEEDRDWISFLKVLDRILPSVEAEVELLRDEMRQEKTKEIFKKAISLSREVLQTDGLEDLEWLRGMAKKRGPSKEPGTHPTTKRTGKQKVPGDKKDEEGFKISLQERPFEEGPSCHSRFVEGVVQVNTLNSDYQEEMAESEKNQIIYLTSLIGKEVVAFNDKSGYANDSLEKTLTFFFAMKRRI